MTEAFLWLIWSGVALILTATAGALLAMYLGWRDRG